MSVDTVLRSVNLVVLAGVLHRPPQLRLLPSGKSVTVLDVKVPGESGRSEVLRVTWFDAAPSALELDEGAAVVVCGRVRRFWFGQRQSITDVVAHTVVTRPTSRKTRKALGAVFDALEEAC